MTKLPRDLRGSELVKALKVLGYERVRQGGSHIQLVTQQNGEHHVTVPAHDPVKVKTLTIILGMVSDHFGITKEQLLEVLFP